MSDYAFRAREPIWTRRRFFNLSARTAAVAGVTVALGGCGGDGVQGAEGATEAPPPPTAADNPPAYTATSNDFLNFALQVHYLLAAFYKASLDGGVLPASLTGGAGTPGAVQGGRVVGFSDTTLKAKIREVSENVVARIGYLRQVLGAEVTAQPTIDIAGGAGGPFDTISRPPATETTPMSGDPFDPYASEEDFLLGAMALTDVATSVVNDIAYQVTGAPSAAMGQFAGGLGAVDSIIRNALFVRADLQDVQPADGSITLFDRARIQSGVRDLFDGIIPLDQDIGGFSGVDGVNSNILISDRNYVSLRRTPEQALGILYASRQSASTGGFFPAGLNGTIKASGSNTG